MIQQSLFETRWRLVALTRTAILYFFALMLTACSNFNTGTKGSELNSVVSDQVMVNLYYATDRKNESPSADSPTFGNQRGELSFGYCEVAINTIRNNRSGVPHTQAWAINGSHSPTRDARVQTVVPLSFQALQAHMQSANTGPDESALIYIHGYAKTFTQSAENMARFIYEIRYQGTPLLFSWPSKGSAMGYSADVATMDWSSHHIEAALKQLSQDSPYKTIHIVAHSLGNRAMLTALTDLVERQNKEQHPWRFGEIILLAPDVDKGLFERDWAPVLKTLPSRSTLYVASEDVPLRFSKSFNQNPRLGDSRFFPVVYDGIDTIDVSDAVTLFNGHNYFRSEDDVLTDLYYLINYGKSPEERPNLNRIPSPEGDYWRLQPKASSLTEGSSKR